MRRTIGAEVVIEAAVLLEDDDDVRDLLTQTAQIRGAAIRRSARLRGRECERIASYEGERAARQG
jgi:hypothetical protein